MLATLAMLWQAAACAHAFPEHEQPGVGAVLHHPPKQISIRFDSRVESAFSTLTVKDASGKDIGLESRVDDASQRTLEAEVPPLAPGEYHVYWKVVSADGHSSEGDYVFTIRP